jgi:hypothetical protein
MAGNAERASVGGLESPQALEQTLGLVNSRRLRLQRPGIAGLRLRHARTAQNRREGAAVSFVT